MNRVHSHLETSTTPLPGKRPRKPTWVVVTIVPDEAGMTTIQIWREVTARALRHIRTTAFRNASRLPNIKAREVEAVVAAGYSYNSQKHLIS